MANFLTFQEGVDLFADSGFPTPCYFLLSTRGISGVGSHGRTNTLAGGVGEITGTGYGRISQALPALVDEAYAFAEMLWQTGAATDWPSSTKSIVWVTSADGSGAAICAWNLDTEGAARDLAHAGVKETCQPTFTLADLG